MCTDSHSSQQNSRVYGAVSRSIPGSTPLLEESEQASPAIYLKPLTSSATDHSLINQVIPSGVPTACLTKLDIQLRWVNPIKKGNKIATEGATDESQSSRLTEVESEDEDDILDDDGDEDIFIEENEKNEGEF